MRRFVYAIMFALTITVIASTISAGSARSVSFNSIKFWPEQQSQLFFY